jgi:hypothetical protein
MRGPAKRLCKLTRETGEYVHAHLLPKALTKPDEPGLPFIQSGSGSKPVRRWSSWYDQELVTRAGEDVLAEFDNWAIAELRRHKLVWSGWGPLQTLVNGHRRLPNTPYGLREVHGINPDQLRLFFLSLLWRAAATTRPEFAAVTIPEAEVEQLRLMLLGRDPRPAWFYPVELIQLSTMGEIHNHTPLAHVKRNPSVGDMPEREIPIFRFYFDGLIVHFQRPPIDKAYVEGLGSMVVGTGDKLTITTVTYEESLQNELLSRAQLEAYEKWPEVTVRLLPK